jgi:hypothetical protein
MRNAVALTTTFYDCPTCPRRNHFREIFVSCEEIVPMDCPAGVCKDCGHRLTKKEAQPMPKGVLRTGWWYGCTDSGSAAAASPWVLSKQSLDGACNLMLRTAAGDCVG